MCNGLSLVCCLSQIGLPAQGRAAQPEMIQTNRHSVHHPLHLSPVTAGYQFQRTASVNRLLVLYLQCCRTEGTTNVLVCNMDIWTVSMLWLQTQSAACGEPGDMSSVL